MENIKIGVGVITVGVRPLKDYLVTDPRADFRVFNDPDRKGVAYARNELMHQFYEEGYDSTIATQSWKDGKHTL